MYYENKKRSIIKTISWRTLATLTTALIVYFFTGKLILALSVGSIEVIAKIILYFYHERAWNKIKYGRRSIKPFVIWFTGLSGAGKSTLADKTFHYFKKRGLPVEYLDGDKTRSIFPNTGFSKAERNQHIKRAGYLASLLEKNSIIVIAAFISPYEESRQFVRNQCQQFIEVYVNTSLETCEKRDPKKLYARARRGEIQNFTGIDDPYEPPSSPDIIIKTDNQTEDESFKQITKALNNFI